MRKFAQQEDVFLRDNYTKIPAKRMAKMLGRSEGTARQRMKLLGLVVPPAIVERFKQESRYRPGNEPENKGKKWAEYMTKRGMKNSRKSQFKKGALPHNTKHDGAITVRTDTKTGIRYKYIRISQANWKPLHVKEWEDKNGKIPEGMIVVFRDGNSLNCALDNLQLITRAENMKRNTVHNYPKEIASTIQLMGALKRKINRKKKKLQNEK